MSLTEQINKNSATVKTQSYSMSLGEMAAMYQAGELELHPEFQRFFRWTPEQKSRLIESILLGIPVPPVFVAERRLDAKWDVIDGLQRLSTILELMGELQGEDGNKKEPLQLTRTHYLPDLEGMYWSHEDESKCLPEFAQIKIKRARIDVNIVSSTSDEVVKYEVFQRLNTGGAKATDQEVRNCLLVMINNSYFNWMKGLSENESFQNTLSLTDRALAEAFDMELVARYLVMIQKEPDKLKKIDELGTYLNEECIAQAKDSALDRDAIAKSFFETFTFLANELKENAFRRFDMKRQCYSGPMLVSIFEVVAVGLGHRLLNGGALPDQASFAEKHRSLWDELGKTSFVGSGVRSSTRIQETIRFGREWIAR
ncbi:MAG: Protein of unknown function DUF262 [Candidatus Electronema aureum]|uniref:GmrSD restriction endonucleases N-terminal domain-containing protein n=1 Tax=Candidatus Electronema aureum TaxID=2005002 RepID=A0A521FZB6_9BACT|nr:MAG: Protein of unknown function DUF262 [Candidatus Electronema aureum]